MDASEVNQKLHYVIELLGDLWHYQQPGAHACSCNVCTNKQLLARSIITKALQEVVVIASCFGTDSNCDVKNPGLNNSCFTCGPLLTEQDVENAVLKDSMCKIQENIVGDINSSCSTLHNNRGERKSSSVSSESLRDSGLSTCLSSQSVSPVISGRCQHRCNDNTQLQVSGSMNEISGCDVVNITQSLQDIGKADTFSPGNRKDGAPPKCQRLSIVHANRTSHLPVRHQCIAEKGCSDILDRPVVQTDSHKAQTTSVSPSNQTRSSKAQTSSFSTASHARSSSASQSLMFLSLPLVSPPAFVDKLEDYCRHSELFLNHLNPGYENTASNINQLFSQLHVAQIPPLPSVHLAAPAQACDPIISSEKDPSLVKNRKINSGLEKSGSIQGSLHQHLSMQEAQLQNPVKGKSDFPPQDELLCSSRSNTGDGCVLGANTPSSHCLKESCEDKKQLHCTKQHAGSNEKSKLYSSSTESKSCSLSAVSLKEKKRLSLSVPTCYNNDVTGDFCQHYDHQLTPNTAGRECCMLNVDKPSSPYLKECHAEQHLHCTKPQTESNEESTATKSVSCSLSTVSVTQQEKLSLFSLACHKNDDDVDCCNHWLCPDTACVDDCGYQRGSVCDRKFCENTDCQDGSHFLWHPWETKDMIVGLISTESEEEKHTLHETSKDVTSVHSDKHVLNATNAAASDSTRMNESVDSAYVTAVGNDTDTLGHDFCGFKQQSLLSSEKMTKHSHQTVSKTNRMKHLSENPLSGNKLSSANISLPHNVNFEPRNQDSRQFEAVKKDDIAMVVPSGITNIKITDEHRSVDDATDEIMKCKELPTSIDRSLKCLSNIVQSSKKNKSNIHNSSTNSTEEFESYLIVDKENSDKCIRNPDFKPASCKMSRTDIGTEKSILYKQLSSLTELGMTSTIDLNSSCEYISQSNRNAVKPDVDMSASHVRFIQSDCNTVKQEVDKPASRVRFNQSEYNSVNKEDMPVSHVRFTEPDFNHDVAEISAPRDGSSRPITSKSTNHIPWGAPAVMAKPDFYICEKKDCQIEFLPKTNQAEKCKPDSIKPVNTHCELKPDPSDEHCASEVTLLSGNHVTFITDERAEVMKINRSSELTSKKDPSIRPDLPEKHCTSQAMSSTSPVKCKTFTPDARSKIIKTNGSLRSTWKDIPAVKSCKNHLNQTLPACKTVETRNTSVHMAVNESYEANQSFPKVTKSHHSVSTVRENQTTAAVCSHGVVTGMHQLSSESPTEPVPRNRRSIFAFSPPDPQRSPDFQKPDLEFQGQVEVTHQNRKSSSADESGVRDLWSFLDASDDIGQIPSIQEVLFNCVTSSICIVDSKRKGKILSLNESFQFLIGVHERVVGQKLFRFIKFGDFLSSPLGRSLAQSFVLSDGRIASVTGSLGHCVSASGEAVPVSVWTVPFKPQPTLTVCVIGVTQIMQADVYLSGQGQVLMYSQPFEDIVGPANEGEKATYHIPDVDFSQTGKPQQISLETTDGCCVPVTLTLASDSSMDAEVQQSNIYSAVLSISMNLSGLVVAGSDGVIKFWDKNYFRINLGHCHLEDKLQISDFLSEIMRVSSGSTASSADSSPVLESKLNTTASNMALADISCLQNGDVARVRNVSTQELYLPQSCFSSQGLVDLDDDSVTGESDDDSDKGYTSVMADPGGQDCLQLPASTVPYQTSTPCKGRDPSKHSEEKDVLMEKGTYIGLFLHGDGSHIPVTFKLSHIQTDSETLFCLWVCIISQESKECDDSEHSASDSENDDEDESEVANTCDEEEDLGNQLRQLHLNKPGDTSAGQMMMDQAGFNQSHNATSEADLLDLEVAVSGSFGNKYAVCEALGQGSFGFVRRAKILGSDTTVVVKFIKKSHMFEDSWVSGESNGRKIPLEVAILRDTYNEHIIKLLSFYENDSFVQMVMEDFGETDLFDFIDQVQIDEPLACYLFRQILWAVDYLHSKKIIHRDIKDENVIVSRSFHCKLIDFGSATYMLPDGEMFTKFRGTLEYCSPEVHSGGKYLGPEVDVWALGVTLYTILFRENPFTACEVPGTLTDFPFPITDDAVTLLLGLLQPDPLKRFTVLRALSCDWLRQIVDLNNYSWCDLFGDVPTHSDSMFELDC